MRPEKMRIWLWIGFTFSAPESNALGADDLQFVRLLVHRGTAEWSSMYLRQAGLVSSSMQAATLMFWAEMGGCLGAFVSGYVCWGLGGRHSLTTMIAALLSSASMAALAWCSYQSLGTREGAADVGPPVPLILLCMLQATGGIGLNAVRSLVGVHAASVAAESGSVGVSIGILEFAGQMGAVLAGQPLGVLADRAGWVTVLTVISLISAVVALLHVIVIPHEEARIARKKGSKGK